MTDRAWARRAGRWLMGGPRRRRVYDTVNRHLPRLLGSRIRRGPAAGLRFEGGDTVGYLLGMSEPEVQRALVSYLRPGSVFFDVGAHAGFLTVLGCRLVGPTGRVHAFEPITENVELLRRNLDRNAFANATLHELALADVTGELRMDTSGRHITAAIDGNGDAVVRAARADDLGLPAPTLVKIDVEGAERAVLDGLRGVLARDRPVLVVEVHGQARAAVEDFLAAADYRTSVLNEDGMPHLLAVPRDRT